MTAESTVGHAHALLKTALVHALSPIYKEASLIEIVNAVADVLQRIELPAHIDEPSVEAMVAQRTYNKALKSEQDVVDRLKCRIGGIATDGHPVSEKLKAETLEILTSMPPQRPDETNTWNRLQRILDALNLPEDASAGKALEVIGQLRQSVRLVTSDIPARPNMVESYRRFAIPLAVHFASYRERWTNHQGKSEFPKACDLEAARAAIAGMSEKDPIREGEVA